MHNNCINKLLNLEGVIVKKVIHADNFVKIYIETKPAEQICPCCGLATKRIHDYYDIVNISLHFFLKDV